MADSNWDTFSERKPHRNVSLLVEDRVYWVSREVLSEYSPVFSAMFYGEFQEAAKEQIELPEKKADDILELLRCIFPTDDKTKKIDYDNVVAMCKLADEYRISVLARRCTQFLASMVEDHASLPKIFKDGTKLGQKESVRACLPLIARFQMGNKLELILDEVPDLVRSALLYQKLSQTRPHDYYRLVSLSHKGYSCRKCPECGYLVQSNDQEFVPYSRCEACPTCRKKTIWQEGTEPKSQSCCRCIDPKARTELEKMGL